MESFDDCEVKQILESCGRCCASSGGLQAEALKIRESVADKNNIDLLFETYKMKVYNTSRLSKEKNKIYLEYHQCGCSMVQTGKINNPAFCNCTVGYTKARFETLFNREVKVELKKSILKGDNICLQVITI